MKAPNTNVGMLMPVKECNNCTGAVSVAILIVVSIISLLGSGIVIGILIKNSVHSVLNFVLLTILVSIGIASMKSNIKWYKEVRKAIKNDEE